MWIDLFVDGRTRRTSASLFGQIRDAIADGRLTPGDRLPPSRALAAELGVARSTVAAVYARLVAEGFLDGRAGNGTFVTAGPEPSSAASGHESRTATRSSTTLVSPAPTGDDAPPVLVDLSTGRPDPRLFPVVDWRRCVTAAAASAPPGYGDPAGLPELRRTIASWVSRSRGVLATPSQVLVTSGAQQAFDLVASTLLPRGAVVAIEDPGYPQARRAFERHGARLVPVPVDHDGMVVDAIPGDADAVYVTPSHQSPTGVTMIGARRRALLARAAELDLLVIEDDYDTEFRYVDRPLEPLQRLDRSGRVVYVGTFSKTLSPSLRLGFVVTDATRIGRLCATRSVVDAQPPHITQAALAELIARGAFDRHLRRARRRYQPRHALVARLLQSLHDDGLVPVPWRSNAGLHSMLELAPDTDVGHVVERLRRRGIVVQSTGDWSIEAELPALLIGFAMAEPAHLELALAAVRDELSVLRG